MHDADLLITIMCFPANCVECSCNLHVIVANLVKVVVNIFYHSVTSQGKSNLVNAEAKVAIFGIYRVVILHKRFTCFLCVFFFYSIMFIFMRSIHFSP